MGASRVLVCVAAAALVCSCTLVEAIVHGRILEDDENIGVGSAEEMPISSVTLTFAEPDVTVQRALVQPGVPRVPSRQVQHNAHAHSLPQHEEEEQGDSKTERQEQQNVEYDDLEYEEAEIDLNGDTGEGSIEPIPIDSMRVRFDPLTVFATKLPMESPREGGTDESRPQSQAQTQCQKRCVLPAMPEAMVGAAQRCNVELVYHRPPTIPSALQEKRPRQGRPIGLDSARRIDTSLRTACGSKCVLEELKLMREDGVPDADRVTGLLLASAGHVWATALRLANQACALHVEVAIAEAPGYRSELSDKQKCHVAAAFMKCIRLELNKNCPLEHFLEDCTTGMDPQVKKGLS